MTVGVLITRNELDANGLRQAAARSKFADAARRMLALAHVLEGYTRTEAATMCSMDRQTLSDWVHRYNEFGLPGLVDRVPPGAKSHLSPGQEAEVAQLVRDGPVLAEHGIVRWRRIDLSQVIQTRFGVHLAERSVGTLSRRLGFRCLSARPRHPGHDEAAQQAHKKTSQIWLQPQSLSTRAASRSSFGGRCYEGGHGLG